MLQHEFSSGHYVPPPRGGKLSELVHNLCTYVSPVIHAPLTKWESPTRASVRKAQAQREEAPGGSKTQGCFLQQRRSGISQMVLAKWDVI